MASVGQACSECSNSGLGTVNISGHVRFAQSGDSCRKATEAPICNGRILSDSLCRLGAAVVLAYLIGVPVTRAATPSWITVNKSNSGFVLSSSGSAFIPWGFNYSRDERVRLIEDYWNEAGSEGWTKIERDFREMRLLGANVVRVNLQFAKFMDGPGKAEPNSPSSARDPDQSRGIDGHLPGHHRSGDISSARCASVGTTVSLNEIAGVCKANSGKQSRVPARATPAFLPIT